MTAAPPQRAHRPHERQRPPGKAEVFLEPVARTRPPSRSSAADAKAGYPQGGVAGGSTASTASPGHGSSMSRNGSAPNLVQAAAVKLENDRLREEIRAMCDTIKYQSSQLSELWTETKLLQARRNGKAQRVPSMSSLVRGVAELSRRQLDPGAPTIASRSDLSRAQSAGSLLSTGSAQPGAALRHAAGMGENLPMGGYDAPFAPHLGFSTETSWRDRRGGQPMEPSSAGFRPTNWQSANSSCSVANSARQSCGGGGLGAVPSHSRLPLFRPTLSPPPSAHLLTRETPAEPLAVDMVHQPCEVTPPQNGEVPPPLGGVDCAQDALAGPALVGEGVEMAPAAAEEASSVAWLPRELYPPLSQPHSRDPVQQLHQTQVSNKIPYPTCTQSGGAVSFTLLAQNINISELCSRTRLASAFKAAIQSAVAQELGSSFSPEFVDVRLSPDSAAIPVVVLPPAGTSARELHAQLCTRQLPGWSVAGRVASLEGFRSVCLSSLWVLCSVGMPSVVAVASDELASTTVSAGSPLADGLEPKGSSLDVPEAVPQDESESIPRPQSLQRSGHTPREASSPGGRAARRAAPKRQPKQAPDRPKAKSTGKVRPRGAVQGPASPVSRSSARQLDFSGVSETPALRPMLLGAGGDHSNLQNGLYIPGPAEESDDARVENPSPAPTAARDARRPTVTQPYFPPSPARLRPQGGVQAPPLRLTEAERTNSSDEELNFIDEVTPPAAARRSNPEVAPSAPVGRSSRQAAPQPRHSKVEQPHEPRRPSRPGSAREVAKPEASSRPPEKEEAKPASTPAVASVETLERPQASESKVSSTAGATPAVAAAAVAAPLSKAAPAAVPKAAASQVAPQAVEVAKEAPPPARAVPVEPKKEAEIVRIDSDEEESSEESETSEESEEESDASEAKPTHEAPVRRKSTSSEVRDILGGIVPSEEDDTSEEEEEAKAPPERGRAESLMSKE